VRRAVADPHVLLAAALGGGAFLIALVGEHDSMERLSVMIGLLIGAQSLVAVTAPYLHPTSSQRHLISTIRFGLTIGFVASFNILIGDVNFRPAGALFVPIVALATSFGSRQGIVVGSVCLALYLGPVINAGPEHVSTNLQRAIAFSVTTIIISVGSRRTISALTDPVRRVGTSRARDRRRSRQLQAVESVGRLLAATGPEPKTLDRVVSLLQDDLGYDFVSLYLGSSTRMRLAAQRGYATVIEVFDGSVGILGRVMRTRKLAWIPDVSRDPDYLSAEGEVRSEISAPLLIGDELVGVVNVEDATAGRLERSDVETLALVADRLAAALALARERSRLEERAELFRRLTNFASAVNDTLDPERLHQQIVDSMANVLDVDTIGLTVLDRPSGRYFVRAVAGPDQAYVGTEMQPGVTLAGRAIRDRALVVDGHYDASRNVLAVAAGGATDTVNGVGMPLIRDDVVVGALSIVRRDLDQQFQSDELEALSIVAGLVALAVSNTFLHTEVRELSVRDPLTGLFNRRYLDASLSRLDASRARRAPDDRQRAAVIIFDLDHFGSLNKLHGHQAGDAVLRSFADILRGRFREADIVARYGGEEFMVVLDGATVDQAVTIADEIRSAFDLVRIGGPNGTPLSATVSAGCAGLGADMDTVGDAVARADVGLSMAKRAGRNRVIAA
jgi:diguanylate cyclase (GGDEF)-like protein